MPELKAIGIRVYRGDHAVLDGLDCELGTGRCLQVTGANGAGKTTLLRVLCGLIEPEEGELWWRGSRISLRSPEYQRALCYLGHLPPLKDDLTGRENLRFASVLRSTSAPGGREAAIGAALAEVGAADFADRPTRSLSTGQRRRVALAALPLSEASLWILDEPIANLDAAGQAVVASLIARQLARGGSVIAATHQELGLPASSRDELVLGADR
ncbi:MAG: cytochrome c biogenesis heme-transporting ATPase CcmA [Gammaproteobacteria bacterium]|nr:cytochrome c biogenesis heme-transporting ATPase CcmA [Gammaproteobacteria bacterium]